MAELTQKNNSITTGDFSFSGAVVTAICGKPLGGQGGTIIGQTYYADNIDIELRTGNIFGLTPTFKSSIPSKVSDLTDSANYQPVSAMTAYSTTDEIYENFVNKDDYASDQQTINSRINSKQNKLTFGYNSNGEISGIGAGSTITAIAGGEGGEVSGNYKAGTDILIIDEYSTIQINTNGTANSAGMAFVEGSDNIASGIASHAEGKETSAMSDYSHIEGYRNIDFEIPGQIGSNHTEGAYNNVSGVYSHIEGHANQITGYGLHAQGGYNQFVIHNMSANKSDPDGRWNIWGISIEGMANATTAEPTSGSIDGGDFGYIHGGILKVIGNGTRTKTDESDPTTEVITRSDALIIYRDGCISAAGNISANGIELGAGGGGGITQVIHDTTLTGQGNGDNSKLGVAWSALSGNTINSAKSAGSAEYITNGVGYSGFDDISAKFNSLSSYVPFSALNLPIGSNNTATNNSIAIGASNTANDLGFAVGQSNTALKRSLAFGVNNYANDISLAIGYGNSASGNNDNNQSAVNIAIGYANSAADHAAAFINVCTAENYAFAAGQANSAVDNSVAFCRNTSAKFYSFGFGHLNHVENYSYAFGRDLHYEGQWSQGSQYGAFVIGGWNATTSYATTADAPLFIIGNGSNGNRSDGFIVYRDGDVTAAGKISANGMFAVSTAATLFGQSRIANVGDTTALGTNWMGVASDGQGFLKAVAGNNVGSLDGTSIQINYKPNNAYGEITVKNSNAGTTGDSKIVHVPTASYNNMNTFDPENGPNYMLRKTASGFDIGAKVVNVTSMPQNTDANTYYFVYEV